jgi:hypothetical protein
MEQLTTMSDDKIFGIYLSNDLAEFLKVICQRVVFITLTGERVEWEDSSADQLTEAKYCHFELYFYDDIVVEPNSIRIPLTYENQFSSRSYHHHCLTIVPKGKTQVSLDCMFNMDCFDSISFSYRDDPQIVVEYIDNVLSIITTSNSQCERTIITDETLINMMNWKKELIAQGRITAEAMFANLTY